MGRTSPGQSHRVSSGVTLSVWKCFVLPGVAATAVFLEPNIALIEDDLPTLGKPVRPTTRRPLPAWLSSCTSGCLVKKLLLHVSVGWRFAGLLVSLFSCWS